MNDTVFDDYYEESMGSEADPAEIAEKVEIENLEPEIPKRRFRITKSMRIKCLICFVMFLLTCGCGLFVAALGLNWAMVSCFNEDCSILVD